MVIVFGLHMFICYGVNNIMANILTCYYKPKPGGFCKRLFMSIHALLNAGHDVHYLAVSEFPISHPRCHFHRFPWPVRYTDNLLFWLLFLALSPFSLVYLGFRYQVNYCYAFNTTYGFLFQLLMRLKRIPLSVFLRADVIENHRLKKRSRMILSVERIVEGFSISGSSVYGVSQTLVEAVIQRHRYLKPRNYGVLRNNITSEVTENSVAETINISNKLRLGCAGILEARKNQALLLQMMSLLRGRNVTLYLFGCGPDEKKLVHSVNQLGLSANVKFMGWVEPEKIWNYIDLLLVPSLHEGAPNIVLEGLAHGIPILASNLPEHLEVLPDCTLLPLSDISAWTNKINQIIDNPGKMLMDIKTVQIPFAHDLEFDWNEEIVSLILQ